MVEKGREETGSLRKKMGKEMHVILDRAEAEITPYLNADQKIQYRALLDQWSEEHRRSVERRKEREKSKWD